MIKAAVLGSPISHSLSPLLHQAAYSFLGVDASYEAIEVRSGGLSDFIEHLDPTWNAFSLTMPLKEELVKLGLKTSDLALRISSANTLHKSGEGWFANTTDVEGFINVLAMHQIPIEGNIVILGAGATARAAAAACDSERTQITVVTRSLSRIESMSKSIQNSQLHFVDWNGIEVLNQADLVISTVPEGATDAYVEDFPISVAAPFFEVLYKPWPTLAAKTWASRGGRVIDGLDLLIHQAMVQVEIFSGKSFDRVEMYTLLRKIGLEALI